jgi:hypothetical protein
MQHQKLKLYFKIEKAKLDLVKQKKITTAVCLGLERSDEGRNEHPSPTQASFSNNKNVSERIEMGKNEVIKRENN